MKRENKEYLKYSGNMIKSMKINKTKFQMINKLTKCQQELINKINYLKKWMSKDMSYKGKVKFYKKSK